MVTSKIILNNIPRGVLVEYFGDYALCLTNRCAVVDVDDPMNPVAIGSVLELSIRDKDWNPVLGTYKISDGSKIIQSGDLDGRAPVEGLDPTHVLHGGHYEIVVTI